VIYHLSPEVVVLWVLFIFAFIRVNNNINEPTVEKYVSTVVRAALYCAGGLWSV